MMKFSCETQLSTLYQLPESGFKTSFLANCQNLSITAGTIRSGYGAIGLSLSPNHLPASSAEKKPLGKGIENNRTPRTISNLVAAFIQSP